MNIGASMVARRVRQRENEVSAFRGYVIGIPVSIAMWVVIIWLLSAVLE
jgi:hypothetical protein